MIAVCFLLRLVHILKAWHTHVTALQCDKFFTFFLIKGITINQEVLKVAFEAAADCDVFIKHTKM